MSSRGVWHRELGQIDAIGVDEIQYAKGHKYLTLVYQIDLGMTRLLWVGKDRTIESFQGFFTAIGGKTVASETAVITPQDAHSIHPISLQRATPAATARIVISAFALSSPKDRSRAAARRGPLSCCFNEAAIVRPWA